MKLTLLFGSYREPSNGRRLLNYLAKKAPEYGFEVNIADAKAIGLPIMDKKLEEFAEGDAPANMLAVSEQLKAADAYILISGEYNAAMPSGLTNLVNHFRSEYANKPVGIVTYSPGALGGARVAEQIRAFVANLGMVSLPMVFGVGAIHERISESGELIGDTAETTAQMADNFLKQMQFYAEALAAQRAS